ncbi:RagB/SusD family nutrient uptake outer membrane protein [Carboxylicivirga taeanensis]|uniref:RagB/SusD family nutrient uptake outer membrane protein n=1 Tax=Carboxylicivirga taeanensis TaxID=1416875 RepID=UPI003F6E2AA2
MKKIRNIGSFVLACLLVGTMVACDEDKLIQESPDDLTSDNFYRNLEDAEGAVAAAYSQLECATSYWAFAEIKFVIDNYRSDLTQYGKDAANYPNWTDIANFTNEFGNTQVTAFWDKHYKGINYANQVITFVGAMGDDKIDPEVRAELVAEARFLRGFYHHKLLLNFEEIIVRYEVATSVEDAAQGLSPRTEAWEHIIADFKAAAEVLPISRKAENIGRVTKGAAISMAAKCLLFRAGEEPNNKADYLNEAKSLFHSVVEGADYSYQLVDNFPSMFDGTNENSSESLFELQLTPITAGGAFYKFPSHSWLKVGDLGGWDEIRAADNLFEIMTKEGMTATDGGYDHRVVGSLIFDHPYYNDENNPPFFEYTWNTLCGWYQAGEWTNEQVAGVDYSDVAFRKYLPANGEFWEDESSVNIPLLRYADVLLMYAEVLNELNEPENALTWINKVRAVHGKMPAVTGLDQQGVREQIEFERIMEFTMEGMRFYDLRRWGKLEEAMNAAGRKYFRLEQHAFFPIPQKEIISNSALRK